MRSWVIGDRTTKEIQCFTSETCLFEVNGFCQCKPDNISPNDTKGCGQYTVAKESK